ncbi:MAG TPA: efflux RND transporter periplasmic adaptor subunit [Vicinamibacterales bacterium]|nr:efflux RND transporter periplasmic adaptor subunit [Vicinamibacterales bacterium]
MIRWSRFLYLAALCAALIATTACGSETDKPVAEATPPPILVGQENVVAVVRETIVTGPIISGELRAAREATVRAELGGSLVQLNVEEGQTVARGAVLGRIEAPELEGSRRSAASSLKSAENQLTGARRETERTQQLVTAGALAVRDLELARNNETAVEAQLADARSRLVTAQAQLGNAVLRAPIAGTVSDRPANRGDVVSPGTALFTIIDPSSMQFEASVPSEELGALRVGAAVSFTVRGYDQPFDGKITRISPAADPTTRQVPIFVSVPNVGNRLVAGLYAEGRVITQQALGLVVPDAAVNTATNEPWVLRVTGGKTEKVRVTIGVRDPRTERVEIKSGVNDKDLLLRGTAQGIAPGTTVTVGAPATR